MLDIQSHHNEDSQSDSEWILDKMRQIGEVEDSTAEQADQMSANNVSCLCGVGPGHCEYDKSSCSHSADYDHFFFAENEDNDEQCDGGESALDDVVLPKVFEFFPDCYFCSCHILNPGQFFEARYESEAKKRTARDEQLGVPGLHIASPSLQNPFRLLYRPSVVSLIIRIFFSASIYRTL